MSLGLYFMAISWANCQAKTAAVAKIN